MKNLFLILASVMPMDKIIEGLSDSLRSGKDLTVNYYSFEYEDKPEK